MVENQFQRLTKFSISTIDQIQYNPNVSDDYFTTRFMGVR